jgi:4-diphosphocytidyl-2-C-methyl-D-erythritol kinase
VRSRVRRSAGRAGQVVEERAPAKLNLTLDIVGRRPDGRHELDSVVVFTGVGDHLDFAEAGELSLELDGPFARALDEDVDNLVLRAARRLAAATGCRAGARITLWKELPVAAGLGGGSADAAATLRGLRRLWRLDVTDQELAPVAYELGADVTVCLGARPARMRGIGERVEPLVDWPRLDLVLVNPMVSLATADVFAELRATGEAAHDGRPRLGVPPAGDALVGWLQRGRNDLEAPARRLEAAIGEVLGALAAQPGCQLARMSGSGATCFGLFADMAARDRARDHLRRHQPAWWVVATEVEGS